MSMTHISGVIGCVSHSNHHLALCVSNNGIGAWCPTCNRWVTDEVGYSQKWLKKDHPALRGVDRSTLPKIGERYYRKCEGPCGAFAICHMHHVAPRALFGEEADRWPVVYLCQPCHSRWHSAVTPTLTRGELLNPDALAEGLIAHLGMERSRTLTAALIRIWKARGAGDAA